MSTDKQSQVKTRKFKAEVNQLLDIVVNSLYTDNEIFVRELISNASDALEKMRHTSLIEKKVFEKDVPNEIRIETDEENNTFTITDTGIGMNLEEASKNLGTIAHSGSVEFLKKIAQDAQVDTGLIGQFGVGFYSAFMVAEKVIVKSRSWRENDEGVIWSSIGTGSYNLQEEAGFKRGTSIEVKLKEDDKKFSNADTIKELIRTYSNFVDFPIFVNGEQVNTVQAIWTKSKSEVSDEEYSGFYNFISPGIGDPIYRLHFTSDVPLAIKALLFISGENMESFGLGRMEPGVSLYCKKVMIDQKMTDLLPEYFRFIKGVVDSEDLPLNISRETMQDSALIAKLKRVLTKRLIKMFDEEASFDPEKYVDFFRKFGMFIKEGVYSDFENRNDLAKLLRFESSSSEADKMISLDEYIGRMQEDQKAIYYLSGPNREGIEAGPYLETFKAGGIEVLYMLDGIDDLVMTALREYKDKKLVSADQAELDLPEEAAKKLEIEDSLPEKDSGDLARWIKEVLGDKVNEVRVSKRLSESPAVLVNPDDSFTTGMQRVMQASSKSDLSLGKMILEINPGHKILKHLNNMRIEETNKDFAEEAANLLFDNTMISAGLLIDPKMLVERSTKILEKALESANK
ncbi:MAG: molecular chaperone HtpG [Candidatus Electryonea clarkiae]|nr:molecular chaperone HtpG [Candidatus Electryonea clarkiae]